MATSDTAMIPIDWQPLVKGFVRFLKLEKGLSPHSVEAYLQDVGKLARFLSAMDPPVHPAGIRTVHLEGFIRQIHDLGLARTSQARILSGVKGFCRYLLTEEILSSDPSTLIESPVLHRHIPDVLSIEEVDRIISAIDRSKPFGQRDRAILEVLYGCGLRVSELTGLRLADLYPELGYVRVIGKNNKERLVPIGDEAIRQLHYYLEDIRKPQQTRPEAAHLVFLNQRSGRLSRVAVFNLVRSLAEAAGIRKTVSPHTFRHSFATHLVEGGADLRAIQEMLGHESITTTEIYAHLDMRFLRETILQFHPANRRNPS